MAYAAAPIKHNPEDMGTISTPPKIVSKYHDVPRLQEKSSEHLHNTK